MADKSKILIADDAELNREILSEMLGDAYEFVYAADGVEAIDALQSIHDIDLVLLDMNMPNKDGFDVLATMNEQLWIESIPVIVISAESGQDFIEKAYNFGVTDYIGRPFNSLIVQKRVENTLFMYAKQKRLVHQVEKQIYEREKINNVMINIFSDIIETRNHESGTHTLNVQTITNLLLNRLIEITDQYHLTKSDVSLISTLSALHDIGKIKIPESILNKPGKLTDEEWVQMKSHTIEGDTILSNPSLDQTSAFVKTARSICRWHHEKYDGGGYPDGLKGDNIPIAAQVVSMADVYDALTSERCYKPAFTHERAVEMIKAGECGTFNPLLIQCLDDIADMLKSIMSKNTHYDFSYDAISVANEVLADDDLPQENLLYHLLELERRKKDFFMDWGSGVQFDYDKLQNKITYVTAQDEGVGLRKIEFTDRTDEKNVLPVEYWDMLGDMLKQGGREKPFIETTVELKYDDISYPYRIKAVALYPEKGSDYIGIVGQLNKI